MVKKELGDRRKLTVSTIEIETITLCNRKCVYCPQKNYNRGNHTMKESLFKKIIDELRELKFQGRVFMHLYGEPLLDKRLPHLVKYTREKLPKSVIEIVTNGDFLSIRLFNILLNRGVTMFNITQHDKNMSRMMQLLFKYIKSYPEKAKKIKYRKITPDTELFNRGGIIVHPKIKRFERCNRPSEFSIVVDYKGNVILCSNDYFSSVIFGNLREESLIDIWNKDYYKKVREDLRRGIFEIEMCNKCIGKIKIN